jgi:hypothetical protein
VSTPQVRGVVVTLHVHVDLDHGAGAADLVGSNDPKGSRADADPRTVDQVVQSFDDPTQVLLGMTFARAERVARVTGTLGVEGGERAS